MESDHVTTMVKILQRLHCLQYKVQTLNSYTELYVIWLVLMFTTP